jgi:hypothetical protein
MEFSPKSNFAKGPSAAAWTEVASSALLRESAGAAMLEMQARSGFVSNFNDAAANNFKMEGARIFLSILMNLTTPPTETPKRETNDNLIHG